MFQYELSILLHYFSRTPRYTVRNGSQMQWGPIFRRSLMVSELNNFFSLLGILSQVVVMPDVEDCRIWTALKEGTFSVSPFFSAMSGDYHKSPLFRLWKLKITPRVVMLNWLALHGGILPMDNLHKCKKIIVNACPMCLAGEQTGDDLLLFCKMEQSLWFEASKMV
eukprot:TRINITY_DN8252_c0_g1_i2.p1 TRINITY_DN8252_c0_g1~~TRINITY_DN8252_c0_g1_i2.p1  ORF type:complete len:166 (+),score=19.89 TRINITY_DN8252_c0_g1_i2:2499-2996(+)